ncbi:Sugar phosphate permease [Paramicrobacterium humi]|uniref:Putative proline/betaine transporter n=1 Tax=Paramicrobacterium humi TaxID=640635 RepID=A0A1H4IXZ1_9MICO|nr:MFS transporter [Microbacterium humi]SEB38971.1 Sugar phosphate permease [Microbacterium humi]
MHDAVPKRDGHANTRSMSRRAAASGWVGSALEYFDFTIYASAAALVFPQVFFPDESPAIALIASLATYGVGYVARPLGAFVLGNFGDKHGRKKVLVFAMLLMGVCTFAVGILPTYAQVGMLAPILLVALRLIQGFAVAGELGGASAMIVEHAPREKRGFYASFSLQGTQAGSILASASFIPLAGLLPSDAFEAWGWRIPFLLSVVVIIAGLVIRSRVAETEVFLTETAQQRVMRAPVLQVFRENWRTIVRAVCMGFANVIGTTVVVFGTAYATQPAYGVNMSASTYLWIPVIANLVAIALIPVFGRISDRIGRRPFMIFGPLSAGVLSFAYLWAVSQNNVVLTVALAILMFGVLYQMWNATFASFFQELFPTRTRVTGFAISQNIALLLVAFLPSLFTLVAPPGSASIPLVIGGFTLVVAAISSIAAFFSPETAGGRITSDTTEQEPAQA